MLELDDVKAAAARLATVLNPTPASASPALSRVAGRPVLVKPEHLQRTGSFKIRGAYNFLASLLEERPAAEVVAASAGNHAQGVALAASLLGVQATIFMPENAPLPKAEATRAYGARVVHHGESVDDCIERARDHATATGATFVPPFDDLAVIAGQATIGLELVAEAPEARVVVVPVGGGGLVSGVAAALKQSDPSVRVVGVEAAGAASMAAALAAGRPVALGSARTMADGIAVRCVSDLTLEHVRRYVDELVTVEEEEISRAVLVLLERAKWVVEPAGAAALAALLAGKVDGSGCVLAVLSGGNIDPLLLTRIVEHGLASAGRFVTLRVVLRDRPGALAALAGALGALGLNVLSVEHHRSGAAVGVDEVEVLLTAETRDPSHRDQVVPVLRAQGFAAESLR
ncbi:MAG TPA: threonine ammonia-lyase [Acidimicrobiales bacterium]|nr:threonine ammonia-lyase [Acidimicrobiales bacterium]